MSEDNGVVAAVLMHGYALDSFELLSRFRGSQSTVWKLRIQGQDLALRQTRTLSHERLSSYLLLAQMLSDNGINVARPMATSDGDLFCRWNDESFTLSDWVHGVTANEHKPDLQTARVLGEILAQTNGLLANYRNPLPLPTRHYQSSSDAIAHINKLLDIIESRQAKGGGDSDIRDALHYKLDILQRQGDLDSSVLELYGDSQLVHGDFNSGNIVIDSHGLFAGLIDLESFHYAPRIWDIVKACMFMFKANWEYCVEFIAGYHQISALNRGEIDAFYPLATDYMLKSNWAYEQCLVFSNQHCNINDTMICHERLLADRSSYESLSNLVMD